jgi:predicted nuclease of predicted toxin-antitoxin system
MAEKIRFHLDENVDGSIADGLSRRNIDVTVTPDVGLLGASDEEQLAFALFHSRVIFTHDADFLRLHRQGVEHAGIVYCHQGRKTIGEIVRSLVRIWELQTSESMYKHVEFI